MFPSFDPPEWWRGEKQANRTEVRFPGQAPGLIVSGSEDAEPYNLTVQSVVEYDDPAANLADSRVHLELNWGTTRRDTKCLVDAGQSVVLPSRSVTVTVVAPGTSALASGSVFLMVSRGNRSNARPVFLTDRPDTAGGAAVTGPWVVPPFARAVTMAFDYLFTAPVDITLEFLSGVTVVQRNHVGGAGTAQSRVDFVGSARTMRAVTTGATRVQPIWELSI